MAGTAGSPDCLVDSFEGHELIYMGALRVLIAVHGDCTMLNPVGASSINSYLEERI